MRPARREDHRPEHLRAVRRREAPLRQDRAGLRAACAAVPALLRAAHASRHAQDLRRVGAGGGSTPCGGGAMKHEESGPMLSPGFWLHHAALAWRAELDARLRPLGLTPTQFMVLATAGWLEHLDGPPTQQQVADGAGTDRQMTSRVVRALQDHGLITRHAHESNARSLRLR